MRHAPTDYQTTLLEAMPGTSQELAEKTGKSVTTVQRALRKLIEAKLCDRKTRWRTKLAYTFVYHRAPKP